MDLVLIQLEHLITKTSDVIWPVFVPFMLILGAYMAFTTIFKIQPKLTKPSKLKFKNIKIFATINKFKQLTQAMNFALHLYLVQFQCQNCLVVE